MEDPMPEWKEANENLLKWRSRAQAKGYSFPIDIYGVFDPESIQGRVLDIGAGGGYANRFKCKYIGIDPFFDGRDVKKIKAEDYQPEYFFDAIFCISVLPHVDDLNKVLANCRSWLFANGVANFVIAYSEPGDAPRPSYVHNYDKNEWEDMLNKYFHRNFSFVFQRVLFYQGVRLE